MVWKTAILGCVLAGAARACDLALVLAVDVSGSVDPQEYRLQMDGLAAALRNGLVAEALYDQQAMVTLVQWTGSSRQRQTLPWTRMTAFAEVEAFADKVENDERVWRNYSTAIGEALDVSAGLFAQVSHCRRYVIDVSGDGESNEGAPPPAQHPRLRRDGVTVNGLAIETDAFDLTGYFYENLITGDGAFVETANGFANYADAILRKLQRETTRAAASNPTEKSVLPAIFPQRDHR